MISAMGGWIRSYPSCLACARVRAREVVGVRDAGANTPTAEPRLPLEGSEHPAACEDRVGMLSLDAQQAVPLRGAFGARRRPDLELARPPADGEVGEPAVLGLARARRERRSRSRSRRASSTTRARPRACRPGSASRAPRSRCRSATPAASRSVEVTKRSSPSSWTSAEAFARERPALAVVLAERVLERDDRVVVGTTRASSVTSSRGAERCDPRARARSPPSRSNCVAATSTAIAASCPRRVRLRSIAAATTSIASRFEPSGAASPPSSATRAAGEPSGAAGRRRPRARTRAAISIASRERAAPTGTTSTSWTSTQPAGVRAAGEHVHHRERQQRRPLAREAAPERLPCAAGRGGHRACDRRGQDGVGAEPLERRRAVEAAKKRRRCLPASAASLPRSAAAISPLTAATASADALAGEAVAAVAELVRLVRPDRGARGNDRLRPRRRRQARPRKRRSACRASRAPPRRGRARSSGDPRPEPLLLAGSASLAPMLARSLPRSRVEEGSRREAVGAREHEAGRVPSDRTRGRRQSRSPALRCVALEEAVDELAHLRQSAGQRTAESSGNERKKARSKTGLPTCATSRSRTQARPSGATSMFFGA